MPRLSSSVFKVAACLLAVAAPFGCGGNPVEGIPFVPSDSSIPDRIIYDSAPGAPDASDATAAGDAADADAADLGDAVDTADGSAVDGETGDGSADGDADAVDATPSLVTVFVAVPKDNDIVPTQKPLVPMVNVAVVPGSASTADDVSGVDCAVWSTGASAKMQSTTKLTLTSRPGAETNNEVDYLYAETPLDLSMLESGTYELHITVTTNSGATGTATRSFRADAGPRIVITKPIEEAPYKGSIAATVQIDDALFGPISNVQMSVGTEMLTVSGPTGNPADTYTTLIDFNSYMPPLDGEQLFKVSATNVNGTRTSATVKFVIDNEGPTIEQAIPAAGAIIGGITSISAKITDPAKVLDSSVVAVVAHGSERFEVPLDADPANPGRYTHQFDTRLLDVHDVYPTLSFRASDLLGNQSSIGYGVALDNTPPLADLDPPADFRILLKDSSIWRCSWRFDPLGSDAVNDGDKVNQLFDIRARVEDHGNTPLAGSIDIVPVSLINPQQVELLILDDTSQPLVVDSDGDGICDKINPLLVPTSTPMSSKDALLVNLVPVPPSGSGDMTPDLSALDIGCQPGTATVPPDPLCLTTDLTAALPYAFTREAAIWSIAPVMSLTPYCVGNQFDAFANNIQDGWACLAVRAADNLGNMQVSRVLRVCIDHDGIGNECPQGTISQVTNGQPIVVTTAAAHGLTTGDTVAIGKVYPPVANGQWTVTVIDNFRFSLDGSKTDPLLPTGLGGTFVRTTAMPDCTGTQISVQPVAVSAATRCTPWASFPHNEARAMN
ncbi:MAG TPA: hypothetical protein VH374_19030 [Polyangia bacterium]|jgi:hypothetical protein|nr:hypothetical protein [Polyangia bacterium]